MSQHSSSHCRILLGLSVFLLVAAAHGQVVSAEIVLSAVPPRGMLGPRSLPEGSASVDPASGMLLNGWDNGVFVWGLLDGDQIPGEEATLWDLEARSRRVWIDHLATHGFNAIGLHGPFEVSPEVFLSVCDTLQDKGLWALVLEPVDGPLFTGWPEEDWEEVPEHAAFAVWEPFAAPLRLDVPFERRALARAVIERAGGAFFTLTSPASGEVTEVLTPFAFWAGLVPWRRLASPTFDLTDLPDGVRGRVRGDLEGRVRLVLIEPTSEPVSDLTFTLDAIADEPYLADVMSLATMRRRRYPVHGPTATVQVTAREVEQGCLILVSPLAEDWVDPEPNRQLDLPDASRR